MGVACCINHLALGISYKHLKYLSKNSMPDVEFTSLVSDALASASYRCKVAFLQSCLWVLECSQSLSQTSSSCQAILFQFIITPFFSDTCLPLCYFWYNDLHPKMSKDNRADTASLLVGHPVCRHSSNIELIPGWMLPLSLGKSKRRRGLLGDYRIFLFFYLQTVLALKFGGCFIESIQSSNSVVTKMTVQCSWAS